MQHVFEFVLSYFWAYGAVASIPYYYSYRKTVTGRLVANGASAHDAGVAWRRTVLPPAILYAFLFLLQHLSPTPHLPLLLFMPCVSPWAFTSFLVFVSSYLAFLAFIWFRPNGPLLASASLLGLLPPDDSRNLLTVIPPLAFGAIFAAV